MATSQSSSPIRVAVTGAAGNIGYATIFRLASGAVFGPNQPIALNLIEVAGPGLTALTGVVMELKDCAFPLLTDVVATGDINEGFRDTDWQDLVLLEPVVKLSCSLLKLASVISNMDGLT